MLRLYLFDFIFAVRCDIVRLRTFFDQAGPFIFIGTNPWKLSRRVFSAQKEVWYYTKLTFSLPLDFNFDQFYTITKMLFWPFNRIDVFLGFLIDGHQTSSPAELMMLLTLTIDQLMMDENNSSKLQLFDFFF